MFHIFLPKTKFQEAGLAFKQEFTLQKSSRSCKYPRDEQSSVACSDRAPAGLLLWNISPFLAGTSPQKLSPAHQASPWCDATRRCISIAPCFLVGARLLVPCLYNSPICWPQIRYSIDHGICNAELVTYKLRCHGVPSAAADNICTQTHLSPILQRLPTVLYV